MIDPLLVSVYVFVLAIFVGFETITKYPLHTPSCPALMQFPE